MHFAGIIGCGLLLYAPLGFASLIAFTTHPQLLLVALIAAFVSSLSPFVTSLFYVVFEKESLTPLLILVSVVVSEVLRVWLLLFLCRAESKIRIYGQLFVASPLRFVSVSAAVGCGFGAVSAMRGGGLLLDATRRLTFYTEGTAAYDLNVCPRFPLLMHSALQSFMLLLGQVAWAVMTGQAVAALREVRQPRRAWRRLLRRGSDGDSEGEGGGREAAGLANVDLFRDDIRGSAIKVDGPTRHKTREWQSPLSTHVIEKEKLPSHTHFHGCDPDTENEGAIEKGEREEDGKQCHHKNEVDEAAASIMAAADVPGPEDRGTQPLLLQGEREIQLPKPTVLHKRPIRAVASLVAAFVLHLVFAFVSLLNSGAYDEVLHEEVPLRGCLASLPLQSVITTISLLWMAWVIQEERVNGGWVADE